MSLAARCPSCGTVFRVVRDQLRVSEGWVRCGRCNDVFNAAEVMFDIDTGDAVSLDLAPSPPDDARAPAGASGSASGSTSGSGSGSAAGSAAGTPTIASPGLPARALPIPDGPLSARDQAPGSARFVGRQEPRFDLPVGPSSLPAGRPEPGLAAPGSTRTAAGSLQFEEPLLRAPSRQGDESDSTARRDAGNPAADLARVDDDVDDDPIIVTDHLPAAPASPAPLAGLASPAVAASPVQALPSFMRRAERTALWRRPALRAALAGGVAVLALALAAQVGLIWRDDLAARLPAAAPVLQALCRLAGCSVQPLRRIESLSVHSSGLSRLEGSPLYRLQVVLHNGADTAVMMPALDLSLTDAQGKLVARRVLQAAELGAPQATLKAGEELPVKSLIATGEHRIDGYTLELFYP